MSDPSPRTATRWIGPIILAGAVGFFGVLLLITFSGRRDSIGPDLREVPVPQGAIVRAADEVCTELDRVRVCEVALAIGPLDGLELPAAPDDLLTEHLVDNGWTLEGVDRGDTEIATLRSPEGGTIARVGPITSLEDDAPDLVERLRAEVDEDVDADTLAVVLLAPSGAERR